MKITVALTAKEKDDTLDSIMFDPCTHILCGEIDCNVCPLRDAAEELRRAQENYARAINRITIEGE